LVCSGLILGAGTGLKLTTAIFIFGSLAALCCVPYPYTKRLKIILVWGCAIFIGILVTSGHWMLFLWQHYHNPVFPLLNGIFHAPGFGAYNWIDTRHLPHNIWQTIFFPFYFAWNGQTTDLQTFFDLRFPIVYLLILLACFFCFKKRTASLSLNVPQRWLLIFFIASYIIWQTEFSVMRYFVAAEMLCPIIIYLLISYLIKNNDIRLISTAAILFFIVLTTTPGWRERSRDFSTTYFDVTLPTSLPLAENALVLVATPSFMTLPPNPFPFPQAYLLPFLPKSWRFVGIPFSQTLPHPLTVDIKQQVTQHNGTIYLLANKKTLPGLENIAKQLGLRQNTCFKIANAIPMNKAFICTTQMI
jgi:hypothetical protein